MAFSLEDSIYSLPDAAHLELSQLLGELEQRIELLRASGCVSGDTVRRYYDERKFLQVAESNAIEGSTLSLGETELAILQGVTITGHDPGYSKDAQALFKAVERVAEMARTPDPVDISLVKEIHEIIMEGRPSAGEFRRHAVALRGQRHVPPKTWRQVMDDMEAWERWSRDHGADSPVVRACVLHTWLTHIHPFSDGNGRTARAVANLEMIRGGLPPAIIRKKDRTRYLDALARSDEGGDISGILDLFVQRVEHALHDLEGTAKRVEGYSAAAEILRRAQMQSLSVYNASIRLLVERLVEALLGCLKEVGGDVELRWFEGEMEPDTYLALCDLRSVPRTWICSFRVTGPGLSPLELLLWAGFCGDDFVRYLDGLRPSAKKQPVLMWSEATGSYPPWRRLSEDAPGADQAMMVGDEWLLHSHNGEVWRGRTPSQTAERFAQAIVELIGRRAEG